MKYTAILRFKNKQDKIIGFRIMCNNSPKNFRDYHIDKLKQLMNEDILHVENLKLTSDNKVIETMVNKQEKVKIELFRNGIPCGVHYVEGTHDTCDMRVQQKKEELSQGDISVICSTEVTSSVDKIRNIVAKYDEKEKRFKPYIIKNIHKRYD